MKHRITHIRNPHEDFRPDRIQVAGGSVSIHSLRAAKEHRITVGSSELPNELTDVLVQCNELHIRWESAEWYQLPAPYSSRSTPGLQVSFTPVKGNETDFLCNALRKTFSKHLKCVSSTAFTTLPKLVTPSTTSSTLQYFSYIPSLTQLVRYIQRNICLGPNSNCRDDVLSLLSARRLDVDYDTISRSLVVSALWESGPEGDAKDVTIAKAKDGKVEVGILNREKAISQDEISLGGWLTVVGEDKEPKTTRFSFPSRHHSLHANRTHPAPTFRIDFSQPTGLHPTLRLTLHKTLQLQPPRKDCTLNAYHTLPSTVFLDRHAFSDPLFLSSHNLVALRSISGATDLEAPEWAVPQWGSAALLELATPSPSAIEDNGEYTTTLPLHLRYLSPTGGGYANATVPYPTVFWACRADDDAKLSGNPFDRTNLGYDALFDDKTIFYHVMPAPPLAAAGKLSGSPQHLSRTVRVPVLDLERSGHIELGTVVVVCLGFVWVCWKLFGPRDGGTDRAVPATPRQKGQGSTKSKKT